ncbi:MAG: SDR family NAD(P)-dependent oxidoreductase, partial [Phycisphaerae bacterium]|nr:SDR family NAD(P)-dependent oxidoreductase [Phycisphaerae bacterium]
MKRDDVVLITGASAGIGEALAVELSSRGLRTALLARRTDRTERLAARLGGDARSLAIACDVTVEGALDEAVALTLQRFGRIDAVVANAGFGVDGALARLSLDDYRRQFETNVFGVLRTAMATRAPLAATRGVFAAVGSVSAYVSAPGA